MSVFEQGQGRQLRDPTQFCAAIADYFCLDREAVNVASSLRCDLVLDSIQIFELILLVEEWLGADLLFDCDTVPHKIGDLHTLYLGSLQNVSFNVDRAPVETSHIELPPPTK